MADAPQLAPLLATLGYPAAAAALVRRLDMLAAYPGPVVVLVAASPVDDALGGVVSAHAFPSLHQDAPVAWLTALAVAPAVQGRGIGRRLVEAAEAWARAQGAERISVNSGLARVGAHAFYSRLGYAVSGQRFTRTFAPAPGAA